MAVLLEAPPAAHDEEVPEQEALVGRVAVVTGAGWGLGRDVALALSGVGARVCVVGRDATALRDTVRQRDEGVMLSLPCDLGSLNEIESAVDFLTRFDRPIDLLVLCPEVHVRHGVTAGVVADLDEQYLVGVRGAYLLVQRLLPLLVAAPGQVVVVDRRPSGPVDPADTQFAMVRGALEALTEGLRAEVAHTGVRVTLVRALEDMPTGSAAAVLVDLLGVDGPVELSEVHLRPAVQRWS